MIPDIFIDNLTEDVDTALAEICGRLPQVEEAARAFAQLIRERRSLNLASHGWPGPVSFDAEAFNSGVPLLSHRDMRGLEGCFLASAERLLPVLERVFPSLGSQARSLKAALTERPSLAGIFLEPVLTGDSQGFEGAAQAAGIPAEILSFLVLEIVKPCLRLAAERLGDLADNKHWFKGYCPVCGAGPDLGFLKDKNDPSEFLISKTGQLWLHCSLCGHIWRFVRLVCPSCGQTDHERLDVFTVSGRDRERIHACQECRHYLLVIDLVERNEKIDPDMAPLGLIHLDVLAHEKGCVPLAQTPWNRL